MVYSLLIYWTSTTFLWTACFSTQHDYYVSLTGSDTNAGTLTDPFRTVKHVQSVLQATVPIAQGPLTVHFRKGLYRLENTWQLTSDDSGTEDVPITYKAFCDNTISDTLAVLTNYPYLSGTIPTTLRDAWNGNGLESDWKGPTVDTVEEDPYTAGEEFCIDRMDVGNVCYRNERARCMSDCSLSCTKNIHKRIYTEELYSHFFHLFGKDLKKEEACIEICSTNCEACEEVEFSGLATLDGIVWNEHSVSTITIHVADLSTILPSGTIPDLFLNGEKMLPAGYPNIVQEIDSDLETSLNYASINDDVPLVHEKSLRYDAETFSQRVSTWTNLDKIQLTVFPRTTSSDAVKLVYSVVAVHDGDNEIEVRGGGAQWNMDQYLSGPKTTTDSRFRVQHVLEEVMSSSILNFIS